MPTLMFNIKFTDEERAILRRQAKKSKSTEADHLRVCMLVDAVVEGDMQAIKLTAGRMREKFVARMRIWERKAAKAV
jgi:hypothetical protein